MRHQDAPTDRHEQPAQPADGGVRILIVGATSAIAQATARLLAADGATLFLAGRDATHLGQIADDLTTRGAARVGTMALDLDHTMRHGELLDTATAHMEGLDVVLVAHGTLPDQAASQADWEVARQALETNFLNIAALLTLVANRLEAGRHGTLCVIGSVAGDRGRRSNYVYGTAKGALAIFLQGLRNRLHPAGVRVVTIKPGFVDTPMTATFTKGPLWATPERVARGIHKALEKRGPEVVYLPGFWRVVMLVIRLIPEPLFKRLRL
ncbi:MAG: SDR family oxidoreductase [Nitrospirae bacterium]|nr:SDR family oxidoreductase [Nitrospirota bacterium]